MRRWTQEEFVGRRQGTWTALNQQLITKKPLHRLPPADISRFSNLYRIVCADLTHARDVGYTPDLIAYLDSLAGRAHNLLYAAPPYRLRAAWDLVARDFPRTLRRHGRFFALGMLLFFGPLVLCGVATIFYPEFAYEVLSPDQLHGMAEMYSEAHTGRDAETNSGMAGYYVHHNVGIAFRCFATGILFGLGSLYFLLYNGIVLGTIFGHVIAAGHGGNILTFACTHGVFELTAIAIAGGAGLQMGYALVATGGRTRLGSLRAAGPDVARIILGAAIMLCIAAAIEAFWSPSGLPPPVKWGAAGILGILLAGYLGFAGRARGAAEEP